MKLPLESEFELEIFTRLLEANTDHAQEMAISAFQDWLMLRRDYCSLRIRYQAALNCLKIHAAGDAGARQVLEREGLQF